MPRIRNDELRDRTRAARKPDRVHGARRRQRTLDDQREHAKPKTKPENLFLAIGDFAADVLGTSFKALKTPLAYALVIYILAGLMVVTKNLLFSRISAALSPVCRIPGASSVLGFCHHPIAANYTSSRAPPVNFDRLIQVQSKLGDIASRDADQERLPSRLIRSCESIKDLRAHVRHSRIGSKNELLFEIDGAVDGTKKAAKDYQAYIMLSGRSISSVTREIRWAKRELDEFLEPDTRGIVPRFLSNTILAPFQPMRFTEDVVLAQYLRLVDSTKNEVQRLLDEGNVVSATFDKLEDHLDHIHDIAIRDSSMVEVKREEVLWQLFTRLGGNQVKLSSFDKELRLLAHLDSLHQAANEHLQSAKLTLLGMLAELDDMKERGRESAEAAQAGLQGSKDRFLLASHLEELVNSATRLHKVYQQGRKTMADFHHSRERKAIWDADLPASSLIDSEPSRPSATP